MLVQVDISYLTIIIAAVVSFIIGAFWYSPLLFGNSWMKLTGLSKIDVEKTKKGKMTKLYLAEFLAQLIMAYVLAHFVIYADAFTIIDGLQVGFWIWLGFAATISLGIILWENKSIKLYLINAGYWLVVLLIQGIILSVGQ